VPEDRDSGFVGAQERLAAIVSNSDDAIYSKDSNALITSWNHAAQKLYGYTPEEAIGRDIVMLIPEENKGEERDILGRILNGERIDHFETERVRKDGSRVPISLTVSPVRNEAGEIVEASVTARNITLRRQLERAQRDLDLQEFIAKVAHELRNPLAVVTGFAEALLRDKAELPPDRFDQMLAAMVRQGERAKRLVHDLLEFSRFGGRGFDVTFESVSISEIVDAALDTSGAADSRDVTIDVPEGSHMESDPMRLEQILVNLLTNAAKYGGDWIGVRARVDDRAATFTVEDDGPGVSADLAPNLFEPFARAEGHRSMGTGLGLAITRHLARALGGDVSYEPRDPNGCLFIVALPITSAAEG
jgi:PAS domain S-box-containing protein